jgi:hypothetical protein
MAGEGELAGVTRLLNPTRGERKLAQTHGSGYVAPCEVAAGKPAALAQAVKARVAASRGNS